MASNIPIIEDAGSMKNGVWVPDWKAMTSQAKKLGAKTVKTRSGKVIYFDNNYNPTSVDENPQMKSGGWLDKYEQGGMVLKQKTEDNYFKKPNPNEAEVSMPPGYVGMGNDTTGRDYSPAWGGQFQRGGKLPTIFTDDRNKVKAYQDSLSLYKENFNQLRSEKLDGYVPELIKRIPFSTKNDKMYAEDMYERNDTFDARSQGEVYPEKIKPIYFDINQIHGKTQNSAYYKKPEQPYIYQEPKRLERTNYTPELIRAEKEFVKSPKISPVNIPQQENTYRVDYTDPETGKGTYKDFLNEEMGSEFQRSIEGNRTGYYKNFQMGGSLPGSVGFTYARTAGSAPANGKYTKKTLASAQDGKDVAKNWLKNWYEERKELPQFTEIASKRSNVIDEDIPVVLKPASEMKKMNAIAAYNTKKKYIEATDPSTMADVSTQVDPDLGVSPYVLGHEMVHHLDITVPQVGKNVSKYPISSRDVNFVSPKQSGLSSNDYDWITSDALPNTRTEANAVLYGLREAEGLKGNKPTTPDQLKGIIEKYNNLKGEDINPRTKKGLRNTQIKMLIDSFGGDPEKLSEINNRIVKGFSKEFPTAQNGQEMSYYQHGLDFKTKGMKNGGWLDAYDVPQAQDGFFKAPDVPEYAKGRDVLTPQKVIDVKKYQDDRSQEIVDQIRNKKSTLKQGHKETDKEAEYRIRKNKQFQQSHPYSNIDDQGTLSRSQSDRTMEGLPEAHSRAYYNDQALDKAMTSLDAAGYITGAGELAKIGSPIIKEVMHSTGSFLKNQNVYKHLPEDVNLFTKGISKNPYNKFDSEINWSNWNKEIPTNKTLMNEYRNIEQTSKANNSWMKNPDGSSFKGTPEQFVQQNSSNFKKAFGNTTVTDREGNPLILHHGSEKDFSEFIPSKVSGNSTTGYEGDYSYFHHSPDIAAEYAGDFDGSYNRVKSVYINSKKPLINPNVSNPEKYIKGHENYDLISSRDFGKNYNFDKLKKGSVAFEESEVAVPYSNNVKSATGNNGMFDMTNPNIYKALVPAAIGAGVLEQKKEGGVVKDDMGYWNPDNYGKVVEIDSPYITMEGVDQPLIGISDEGDQQYMLPGKNYKFKGKKVREYPVAKNGLRQEQKGLQNLDQLTNFTNYNKPQPGGWLNKYN